jgi:Protein of unknown function (DUF3105)
MRIRTALTNRRVWFAAGLAAAGMTLLLLARVGFGAPSAAVAVADPPGEDVAAMDGRHVPFVGAPHEPYNSVPPTSGPHVPFTIATGVYREEIPEELQVHALEHGHVLVQYWPAMPREQVRLLEGIARRYPREVVVAPYGRLEGGVAITAWGRIERLDRVDPVRIAAFVEAFAGRYEHGWRRRDLPPDGGE